MSIEQFETELALAGYNAEQIAEAKAKIQECAESLAQALEEVIIIFREALASTFEQVKEAFAELSELLEEVLDEESPNTKYLEPSKRLAYVNTNRVTNEVVKRYYNKDIRSMNMRYTRYRQKR